MRLFLCTIALALAPALHGQSQDTPRFRSGVDLITVTATVTDNDGRFVADLAKEDFSVYEDGKRQMLTQFTRERVPVSLGILLDASGSMNAEKLRAATTAISHLVFNLLDKDDELFFVEFGFNDAIALALPTAQEGRHDKKALLVISDGNDTRSLVTLTELRRAIVETDVLVYAIGIDNPPGARQKSERMDVAALRAVTDQTGGRTDTVRGAGGLDATIARIAEELRQQYSLGYATSVPRDGRLHELRVDVHDRRMNVRARRGFIASLRQKLTSANERTGARSTSLRRR